MIIAKIILELIADLENEKATAKKQMIDAAQWPQHGAIFNGEKREKQISGDYRVAWKAWEDAYYQIQLKEKDI